MFDTFSAANEAIKTAATMQDWIALDALIEQAFTDGCATVIIKGRHDGNGALVQWKDVRIKTADGKYTEVEWYIATYCPFHPQIIVTVQNAIARHDDRPIIDESAAAAAAYCRIAYNK